MFRTLLHIIAVNLIIAGAVLATVPQLIHYQGYLTGSGPGNNPENGTFEIKFSIWDQESNGTMIWDETHNGVVLDCGIVN